MIQCEKCKRILGTIHESEELEVRGEVTLVLFCKNEKCKHINNVVLYEYNKNRIKDKKLR